MHMLFKCISYRQKSNCQFSVKCTRCFHFWSVTLGECAVDIHAAVAESEPTGRRRQRACVAGQQLLWPRHTGHLDCLHAGQYVLDSTGQCTLDWTGLDSTHWTILVSTHWTVLDSTHWTGLYWTVHIGLYWTVHIGLYWTVHIVIVNMSVSVVDLYSA